METKSTFQRLVKFAIKEEQKAQDLYEKMALATKDPYTKAILEGLHEQEVLHEKKLRSLLASLEPRRQ